MGCQFGVPGGTYPPKKYPSAPPRGLYGQVAEWVEFFANPVFKNPGISKSWSSWSKILTNDWPVDPVDFAFSPQVHFKTSYCFTMRDWNPEQVRSKGIIGVGAREGKGARAFMLSFIINIWFSCGKKILTKVPNDGPGCTPAWEYFVRHFLFFSNFLL